MNAALEIVYLALSLLTGPLPTKRLCWCRSPERPLRPMRMRRAHRWICH